MASANNRGRGTHGGRDRARFISGAITIWAVAMVLGVMAAGSLGWKTADAHQPSPDPSPSSGNGDGAGAVYVWSGILTVGEGHDATSTYLGYMPARPPVGEQGHLKPRRFTYAGVDYVVQTLVFQQDDASGVKRLVFKANVRLPDHLILYVGNQRFDVSDSTAMGIWSDIHVWSVNESPDWTEGQTTYVTLLEPHSSGLGEVPICLPKPADCSGEES